VQEPQQQEVERGGESRSEKEGKRHVHWVEIVLGVKCVVPLLVSAVEDELSRERRRFDEGTHWVHGGYKDGDLMIGVGEKERMGDTADEVTGELTTLVGHKQVDMVHAEQTEDTFVIDFCMERHLQSW
jgi:hypothetical protein